MEMRPSEVCPWLGSAGCMHEWTALRLSERKWAPPTHTRRGSSTIRGCGLVEGCGIGGGSVSLRLSCSSQPPSGIVFCCPPENSQALPSPACTLPCLPSWLWQNKRLKRQAAPVMSPLYELLWSWYLFGQERAGGRRCNVLEAPT